MRVVLFVAALLLICWPRIARAQFGETPTPSVSELRLTAIALRAQGRSQQEAAQEIDAEANRLAAVATERARPTATPWPTLTPQPTQTSTPTPTLEPTATATSTPTATPTWTPEPTITATTQPTREVVTTSNSVDSRTDNLIRSGVLLILAVAFGIGAVLFGARLWRAITR